MGGEAEGIAPGAHGVEVELPIVPSTFMLRSQSGQLSVTVLFPL
jgi:hypothetical protein